MTDRHPQRRRTQLQRDLAKARRRELVALRWQLTALAAVVVATNALLLIWRGQQRPTWFEVGFIDGTVLAAAFAMLVCRTYSLTLGTWAESWTRDVLDRRPGWVVFHDVPFKGFNVDHLAVTDSAVLVIETKYYGPGPAYGRRQDEWPTPAVDRHVGRVRKCAEDLGPFIRKQLNCQLPIQPMLVIWGPGVPEKASEERSGVWVVDGNAARETLQGWGPCRLPRTELEAVCAEVRQWTADRDAHRQLTERDVAMSVHR